MAGNWRERGVNVIARRLLVRDVYAVTRPNSSPLHLSSTFSSTSQCLLPPPPSLSSFLSPARYSTFHLSSPGQLWVNPAYLSCPLLASLTTFVPSSSSTLSSLRCITTSPFALKTPPRQDEGLLQGKVVIKQDNSAVITVIDINDKVSTSTLDKAQRLARRQDLKLVKVDDPSLKRTDKAVYRLLTGKQYFEEQKKAKSEKKSSIGTKDEKTLTIGGNITSHDLTVKLHSVTKWLSKGHQIKVTISCRKATKEDVEKVFSTIEEEVKKVQGRVLQRHEKMNDIRFYIAPPKDKKVRVASSEAAQPDHQVQSDESSEPTNTKAST